MAAVNISTRMPLHKPEKRTPDCLASSKSPSDFLTYQSRPVKKYAQKKHAFTVRSMTIAEERDRAQLNSSNGLVGNAVCLISFPGFDFQWLFFFFWFGCWESWDTLKLSKGENFSLFDKNEIGFVHFVDCLTLVVLFPFWRCFIQSFEGFNMS